MNPKRLFMMLVTLPLLLFVLSATAQDKQVTGKVTDLKDGKPIAGASVVITRVGGTQTGADGTFFFESACFCKQNSDFVYWLCNAGIIDWQRSA